MNGKLKIEPATRRIVMDRTFAKFYCDTTSEEYAHLQRVRADYPNFSVVRRRIRKNTKQEHYAGLDYAYMEDYKKRSATLTNKEQDTMKDMKIKGSQEKLQHLLVTDGEVNIMELKKIGKDMPWLDRELKKQNLDRSDVFFAVYDENSGLIVQKRGEKDKGV